MEGSWVLPVGEANVLAVRSGAAVDGNAADDETDDGENLDGGKPEFALGVGAGTEEVDDNDDDEADGDPQGVRVGGGPVVDEDGAGGKLGGENDEPVVRVVKGKSESPRGVDEAVGL